MLTKKKKPTILGNHKAFESLVRYQNRKHRLVQIDDWKWFLVDDRRLADVQLGSNFRFELVPKLGFETQKI